MQVSVAFIRRGVRDVLTVLYALGCYLFQSPSYGAVFGTGSSRNLISEPSRFSRLHTARCSGRGGPSGPLRRRGLVSVAFIRRGVRDRSRPASQTLNLGFSRLHTARCSGLCLRFGAMQSTSYVSVAFIRRGVRDCNWRARGAESPTVSVAFIRRGVRDRETNQLRDCALKFQSPSYGAVFGTTEYELA